MVCAALENTPARMDRMRVASTSPTVTGITVKKRMRMNALTIDPRRAGSVKTVA